MNRSIIDVSYDILETFVNEKITYWLNKVYCNNKEVILATYITQHNKSEILILKYNDYLKRKRNILLGELLENKIY